jgi:uncharacterized protein with von Willebrand factor type A (vWA) domain
VILAHSTERRRPRRGVLLLDVSGSMVEFTRPMLLLGHALVRERLPWQVVCFGTRVTNVTRALARPDADAALAAVADCVLDFDGGTRIGASLAAVVEDRALRNHLRGAIAVVHSDGLEIGDFAELGTRMAELCRLAHRTVWSNPYRRYAEYEPTAAGMRVALPHLDALLTDEPLELLAAIAAG